MPISQQHQCGKCGGTGEIIQCKGSPAEWAETCLCCGTLQNAVKGELGTGICPGGDVNELHSVRRAVFDPEHYQKIKRCANCEKELSEDELE